MSYKELIKQEIERLKHTSNAYDRSRFMLLLEIEEFIDSLPEESGCEVNFTTKSEDLEEEIDRWIKEKHFIFTEIDEIIETARHFAHWQKQKSMQDFMEKAVEHLEPKILSLLSGDKQDTNKFIEDFKNHMKNDIL